MKLAALGKMPWDMVVFLTITTVGLGVSFKRLAYPEQVGAMASVEDVSASGTLDLGCIDRRSKLERMTFSGTTVKVKGQICDISRKLTAGVKGVRVLNETSREEGTVFLQGNHAQFVSNRMVMKPGKNTVRVEWMDPASGQERSVTAELFEP